MKIPFLSLTCEEIGVAMVTNMIRQLQESIPSGAWPVLLKKWLRGAKTVQLPLTFSMSCQVFTLILFPRLMNIEEDLPKAMLKNSANNKKDILRLKISQNVSGRKAPRN